RCSPMGSPARPSSSSRSWRPERPWRRDHQVGRPRHGRLPDLPSGRPRARRSATPTSARPRPPTLGARQRSRTRSSISVYRARHQAVVVFRRDGHHRVRHRGRLGGANRRGTVKSTMPPHSLGSGTISFGLVSIPIRMYTAASAGGVSFNLLHAKCGNRIRYQQFCPVCEETVDRSQIVKGYEFAKDQYVRLTDEELKTLEGEASKIIDIAEFVPLR